MWFRVELNKDGSVASCKQVSGSFDSSRHVRYIEADSAKSATVLAAKWFARLERQKQHHAKYRLDRKRAGMCVKCKSPAILGRTRCEKHAAEETAERRRNRKRREGRERREGGVFVDLRYDNRPATQKWLDERARGTSRKPMRTRLKILTEVLRIWDQRGAQDTYTWLSEEVGRLTMELERRDPRGRKIHDHMVVAAE